MSMYKKIGIIALITIIIIVSVLAVTVFAANTTQEKIDILNNEHQENTVAINEITTKQDALHNLANVLRETEPDENEELLVTLGNKWLQVHEIKVNLTERNEDIVEELIYLQQQKEEEERLKAEEAKWAAKANQYPSATYIWRFLKSQGFNDYVCAGIMGNIMTEVGGQTLNINWSASGNGYYGICQWNKAYSNIWGAGLEAQCNYLLNTLQYEFDTFGFKYYKGFNYNAFINMTNSREAALAFAKSYERCSSAHYGVRQDNAVKAYNYFVN